MTSLLISLIAFQATAQDQESLSPILFIYDASGSMWGKLEGKTKKEIAANVLSNTIKQLPDGQNVSLMAYGHRVKRDCDDIELLVDLENSSKEEITSAVNGINPLGRTPLARSATLAINAIKDNKTKATIILITDGIESCDGDICDVVTKAKAEGIEFKLHIVGFGLKEGEIEQLKCAAQAGDGRYYDAANAGALSDGLAEATSETVDDPDPNISIYAIKNGEPIDVSITGINVTSKRSMIGGRTYKDTVHTYLPPATYDLAIQPVRSTDIEAIVLKGIEIEEGSMQHHTVSFDGGNINVMARNQGEAWDVAVSVVKAATGKTIATTRTYGKVQSIEIAPGTYNITFRALGIKGKGIFHTFENVEVKGGKTIDLDHNFENGNINIVTLNNGEGWDATVRVIEKSSGKHIVTTRTYKKPKEMEVTPGMYDVKVKAMSIKGKTAETIIENVEVKAGKTIGIEHNFLSGIANIGVTKNGELVDCTVRIIDAAAAKQIVTSRTYTSPKSNPKTFILSPGTYTVKLRGKKNGKNTDQKFSITVEEGKEVTKVVEW